MRLEEWRQFSRSEHDLLIACSTIDVPDGKSRTSCGMCAVMWTLPIHNFVGPMPGDAARDLLLHSQFSCGSDMRRRVVDLGPERAATHNRQVFAATLTRNGLVPTNSSHEQSKGKPLSSPQEYWEAMCHARFVASPEGNGIDCHRTYEALWAGAIPILERTNQAHIERVYGNVPVVWTDNFSEITVPYLEAAYAEMMARTDYDFSRLRKSCLEGGEQLLCNTRSRFWFDATGGGKFMSAPFISIPALRNRTLHDYRTPPQKRKQRLAARPS